MKSKTAIVLLGIMAVSLSGANVYADSLGKISKLDKNEIQNLRQNADHAGVTEKLGELGLKRPSRSKLTNQQRDIITKLKKSGDHEAVRDQLDEWGIERPRHNGDIEVRPLKNLTAEQRLEMKDAGVDALMDKLTSFANPLPKPFNISTEQKATIERIKEEGNHKELHEYYKEIGLKKAREQMQKRASLTESLTEEEKEALQEARDIARAGDKETAREIMKEVFESIEEPSEEAKSFFGFIKNMFK